VVTKTIKHPELGRAISDLYFALPLTRRQIQIWTHQAKISAVLLRERKRTPATIDEAILAARNLLRELLRAKRGAISEDQTK